MLVLDAQMDFDRIPGLSSEVKERLKVVKPTNMVSVYQSGQSCASSDSTDSM